SRPSATPSASSSRTPMPRRRCRAHRPRAGTNDDRVQGSSRDAYSSEMRVIATAGHVDHGKSTLVTALTGIDPDRFEEEKRRGLPIDLGFSCLPLPSGLEIGIVDVPGHERFIRNMLAGVGAVDAVLFVVAADEGWMPQSAEHLQILDFLGVERGVVALTKTDVAGDLADEAEIEVRDHLAGTPFEAAPIVRVSAKTGEGLDDLVR